ncbi:MAG: hypothetical protein JOZ07_01790 [Solirubrobacterales bacterium]|nr:hypothetical protein [Solirubrobacterales bacterium]
MQRPHGPDQRHPSASGRGAASAAPRSTPLTLVAGAVAGDDLSSVTGRVAEALGRPVAIAIPSLGEPVVSPPHAVSEEVLRVITEHAEAVAAGVDGTTPDEIEHTVAIAIGEQLVGVVAVTPRRLDDRDRRSDEPAPPHGRLSARARARGVGALPVRIDRA